MEKPLIQHVHQSRRASAGMGWRGFSLMELVVTVGILLVTTAIAIPLVQNASASYQMRSAVDSLTGVIQATRYQAISSGYEYQLVMTKATSTYQLQSDPNNSTNCSGCANVGKSQSLWDSGAQATLGADTTLLLHPSGRIDVMVNGSPGTMPITLTVNYGKLPQENITVSAYGSISVSP